MSAFDDIAKFRPEFAERLRMSGTLPPDAAIHCHRADGIPRYDGWHCYAEVGHKGRCNMIRITDTGMAACSGPSGVLETTTIDD